MVSSSSIIMSSSSCDPSSTSPESAETCWCTVPLDKTTYTWIIDNFSAVEEKKDPIFSSTFSAPTNDNSVWKLMLRPCGKSGAGNVISVFLVLSLNSKSKKVCGNVRFCILNEKHEEIWSIKFTSHLFDNTSKNAFDEGDDWGWSTFLVKDEFFRNELVIDNKLTIFCELSFFEMNAKNIETFFHRHRCNTAELQHLSEDLASVYENQNLADVVLSVKSKEYPVHKVILSARSKVFASMFSHDTLENKQNRVEIPDIDEEVMEEMLRYLYSGSNNYENVEKLAENLLAAAEKYGIAHLKKICEESLYKNLTVENAPNVLVLADTYHANELKSKVIDFIIAKSPDALGTATWNNVMPSYPLLLNEVLFVAVSHKNAT